MYKKQQFELNNVRVFSMNGITWIIFCSGHKEHLELMLLILNTKPGIAGIQLVTTPGTM